MTERVAIVVDANVAKLLAEMAKGGRGVDALARTTQRAHRKARRSEDVSSAALTRSTIKHEKLRARQMAADMKAAKVAVAANKRAALSHKQRVAAMGRGVSGGAGSMVSMALGGAGLFAGAAVLKNAYNFETVLTDIAMKGDMSSEATNKLRSRILGVSNATGIAKEEVASYLGLLIKQTGNVDLATNSMALMGKVAVASGAKMGDLAGIMAKLPSLGVKTKDAKEALNILLAQGEAGAMELENIPSAVGRMAAPAAKMGVSGLKGIQQMGTLLQLTQRGFSPGQEGEAANAASRFLDYMMKNRVKVEQKLGVSLGKKTKKGFKFKDLGTIMQTLGAAVSTGRGGDIMQKSGAELFGLKGQKAVTQLGIAYKQGWYTGTGKDPATGRTLVAAGKLEQMGKFAPDDPTGKKSLMEKRYRQRMESDARKIKVAWNKLSNEMHKNALPVLKALGAVLPKITPVLGVMIAHLDKLLIGVIAFKVASLVTAAAASKAAAAAVIAAEAETAKTAATTAGSAATTKAGVAAWRTSAGMVGLAVAGLMVINAVRAGYKGYKKGGVEGAGEAVYGKGGEYEWLGDAANYVVGGTLDQFGLGPKGPSKGELSNRQATSEVWNMRRENAELRKASKSAEALIKSLQVNVTVNPGATGPGTRSANAASVTVTKKKGS